MTDAIVEEVLRRVLEARKPAALLLGAAPTEETGYRYVTEPPYDAVILGSMNAYQLLHFPDEQSLNALLEGKPVYFCQSGELWRQQQKTAPRELFAALLQAHRRLLRLGVRPLRSQSQGVITASELRRRLKEGLPVNGRLTPLARDILEGRAE